MTREVRLLILGARIFAEEVADLAADVAGLRVVGFVENLDRDHPRELCGRPVYWIEDIASKARTHQVVCALTTTRRRRFVAQAAAMGFDFARVLHPAAHVSPSATIGPGAIVSAGCVIAAKAVIGAHVVLNRGTLIGHHTELGDFVTVQPRGNIAGLCRIGAGAYFGLSATVVDRMTVGAGAVVGAGSLVTKLIPARAFAAGVPARVTRRRVPPR